MNNDELKRYIGLEYISIIEAMRIIDANSAGLIYIVDNDNKLKGCLTDGDIRRGIIETGDLNCSVDQVMNKNPKYVLGFELDQSRKIMEREHVYSLAVINRNHEVIDIVFRKGYMQENHVTDCLALQNTPIVIMAGGKGTRLYPYTKILPKPLIPVGEIPILERILNRFSKFGAREFYLTVNYKKEMIKSYFSELNPPYIIRYVEEDQPLGTAGSLCFLKDEFETPVIVTNCDILIEADYRKVMNYHMETGNEMTIVSALKNTTIPYGVIHSKEGGIVTSMEEKPQMSYFINTGMYVVNYQCFNLIPKNQIFHMTDLAEKLMKEGKRVGMYPISENAFLDMGEFEEMKKMEERVSSNCMEEI